MPAKNSPLITQWKKKHPGEVVTPEKVKMQDMKKHWGGKLPQINGSKHSYPTANEPSKWRVLYAEGLSRINIIRKYLRNGKKPPKLVKDPAKYDYLMYHARPKQRRNRSLRNQDRKAHLTKGDKRVVHHTNPRDLKRGRTVVLSFCEHQKIHGKTCTPAQKRRERMNRGKKKPATRKPAPSKTKTVKKPKKNVTRRKTTKKRTNKKSMK